ncbi:MAG: hypothetical protein LQ342_004373 [Letrouitia transgressa]|nr:MAG: hypothetical protein LQ342_004373 [Letrouitia transgressa]
MFLLRRTSATSIGRQITPPPPPPPPPSRPLRRLLFLATLSLSSLTLGLYLSTHPRTTTLLSLLPPSLSLHPPFSTFPPSALETYILNHPLAARLRADPRWTESRPHLLMPPPMRAHSLTAHSLFGDRRIPTAPLVFTREEEGDLELVSLVYLGADLSGHVGIVHGGMVATLMDEGLARCCFAALPNGVGVTARLEVDFKRPVRSEGWVVVKARVEEVEGRKAWVRGRLEVLGEGEEEGGKGSPWEEKGEVLAEARGLFMEPRWAKVWGFFFLFESFTLFVCERKKDEADEWRRIYRSCSNRCGE